MHDSGDITEDVELIEGLEETKRIATDIEARSALAKETQVVIQPIAQMLYCRAYFKSYLPWLAFRTVGVVRVDGLEGDPGFPRAA